MEEYEQPIKEVLERMLAKDNNFSKNIVVKSNKNRIVVCNVLAKEIVFSFGKWYVKNVPSDDDNCLSFITSDLYAYLLCNINTITVNGITMDPIRLLVIEDELFMNKDSKQFLVETILL